LPITFDHILKKRSIKPVAAEPFISWLLSRIRPGLQHEKNYTEDLLLSFLDINTISQCQVSQIVGELKTE
jgi:hypothetical protein